MNVSMAIKFTFCDTLGVWITCDDDLVRSAYREMAGKAHPDRGGNADDFAKIAQAYHALKNNDLRCTLREELAFVGDLCQSCSGTGAQRRTISFTEAAFSQCSPCRGAGYLPRLL